MKQRIILLFIFSYVIVAAALPAIVDTVTTFSLSMNKEIPAIIVTPNSYNKNKRFPVVYLLHGHSGNYASWTSLSDEVMTIADQYNFIIVCADGNTSSWYFDSPMDSTSRYETYISKELVEWVDSNYNTIPNRKARAISGLSMGGHGAFYLAFRHQDIYGACGSMSGGVDIRPFPNNWGISKHLGKQSKYPANWEKNTVINLLYLLTPNSLAITFDCGTEDFFFNVNVSLHQEMMKRNIPHKFTSRPGTHNWNYWKTSIKYHALFFNEYFNQTFQP